MREKDEQAPLCRVCGREKGHALGYCSVGRSHDPDAKLRCATLGYEREKARADAAERLADAAVRRFGEMNRKLHERIEAAEAAQAKLTEALRRCKSWINTGDWTYDEMVAFIDAALASANAEPK